MTPSLPLFRLYTRLREAGLPLGVEEYEWLLRALAAGFGFDGPDALRRLCKTLWIKSAEEEAIFDHFFAQFLRETAVAHHPPPPQQRATTEETPPAALEPPADAETAEREEETTGDAATQPAAATTPPTERSAVSAAPSSRAEAEGPPPVVPALVEMDAVTARLIHRRLHVEDEAAAFAARYRFGGDYLPITPRQMKQSWRYLRQRVREGPPVELDVAATVQRTAEAGVLYDFVLRPRRVNRAELVLLLDQEGSMVPFHAFSRRLAETAVRGGKLGQADVYYFQNCPGDYLYHDPHFSDAINLNAVLDGLHPARTAVLIFSDAGAARRRFDGGRVTATEAFLDQMQGAARRLAWLNPTPASRWAGSSAAAIARRVPMFEISRRGLQDAISVLRGRSVPGRGKGGGA